MTRAHGAQDELTDAPVLLHHLARALNGQSGHGYLAALLGAFSYHCRPDLAIIAEVSPVFEDVLQTVLVMEHGQERSGFSYPLDGSPCGHIQDEGASDPVMVHPDRVVDRFPQDNPLRRLGTRAYAGARLRDPRSGQVVGSLALLFNRDLTEVEPLATALRLVADRVAMEVADLRAAGRVRRREAWLGALFQHLPFGAGIKDSDRRYIEVNRALADVIERTPEEYVGRRVRELYEGPLGLWLEEMDSQTLNSDALIARQYAVPVGPGQYRHFERLAFPVRDEDGAFIGIGFINAEITELKLAQEALARDIVRRDVLADAMLAILRLSTSRPDFLDYLKDAVVVVARAVGCDRAEIRWFDREPGHEQGRSSGRWTLQAPSEATAAWHGELGDHLPRTSAGRHLATVLADRIVTVSDRTELDGQIFVDDPLLAGRGAGSFADILVEDDGHPILVVSILRTPPSDWSGADRVLLGALQGVLGRKLARDALVALTRGLEETVEARTREAELTRARLSDILTAITDGIFEVATDGTVQILSGKALESLGLEGDAPPVNLLWALQDRCDEDAMGALAAALGAGTPFELSRIAVDRAAAGVALLDWRGLPCTLPDGRPGVRGTIVDVTTRAAAQDMLVASESFASLGRMVASVTHEVSTPIGVAVTVATSLLERVRDVERRIAEKQFSRDAFDGFIDSVRRGGSMLVSNLERAARIMQAFKQVSVDQSHDEPRDIALRAYIETVLESMTPVLRRESLSVTVEIPEALHLITHPGALTQVISNLVGNASVHAYGSQGGELRIAARDLPDGRIELSVQDFGVGIPADHLSRVWEPFFTTRRGRGGSGLGLEIVRDLVQSRLNGSITLASTPGEGSTFTMILAPLDGAPQSD